ncbi:MAG: hypothetical protein Q8N99_01635 [Nanoarchaeota archaeon]|nr:hypothetical protein [Nanoarchaeota archaeon]
MGLKIIIHNKKGFFFTVSAIFILSLFILGYGIYQMTNDRTPINKRIDSLNDFMAFYEKDLPRQIYITGFRSIFLAEKSIVITGNPVNNISAMLSEAFFNGTMNGEHQELIVGARLSDLQRSLSLNSRIMNLNGSLNARSISITQEDPWNVLITLDANIYIYDLEGLAYINTTKNITTYIPINNFEDPLYVIYTGGIITNKIKKTIFLPFVTGSDVTNLINHAKNSSYIDSTLAPSFLDRIEGRITPSPYGIESLVDAQRLSLQSIPVRITSCVDYIYLVNNITTSHQIQGMPSWFRLDDAHLDMYNVTGLVI